jgi:SagB-type dehydrogenase family enzyme
VGWLRRRSERAQSEPAQRDRAQGEPEEPETERALRAIRAYHQSTKHHLHRYAAGPPDLDWDTQPDPFLRYAGAPLVRLEEVAPTDEPRYEPAFVAGEVPAVPLSLRSVSQLFYDSLALSAWKSIGVARWSLRVNPSSGNLHPTEAYLVSGPLAGASAAPFVAHYAAREHALELRAELPAELWRRMVAGLPRDAVLIGLTSIAWREAWKYGERAFRYCQHDLGHALGALAVAAAALGWRLRVLERFSSAALTRLLGVADPRGAEGEEAEALVALHPAPGEASAPSEAFELEDRALEGLERAVWRGKPGALSPDHVEWSAIDAATLATRKPATPSAPTTERSGPWLLPPVARDSIDREPIALRRIVRQRRSAVALDGRTGLARAGLLQALARTLPGEGRLAIEGWPWRPRVDLAVFVHRIADLEPGLYVLVRDPRRTERLRASWRPELEWAAVEGLSGFHRLRRADVRAAARASSCHQEIAADGCFAVAMLAELEPALTEMGPWIYRRLHWECGWIGQLLYLEAEALGLRATGIGCFFDDVVHEVLGQRDASVQDLYHFTVGGPTEDPRLTTLPAYPAPSA